MKYLLTGLLITVSLTLSTKLHANSKEEIDKLTSPIMALFEQDDFSKVASTALANSSVSDYITKSDLAQTDSQFEGNFGIMGKYYSAIILHEQEIEDVFTVRWYLLKFQRQPVLLHMEFYKPNTKWEFHSIKMITDLDDYLEEQGRYEIGKMGVQF